MDNYLYSCPEGQIRNTRTGRCVRRDRALGRAIEASYRALLSGGGGGAKKCGGNAAWDAAAKACVSDARAGAIRNLERRFAAQRAASNAEASLAAKNLASKVFDAARARDAASTLREGQELASYWMQRYLDTQQELERCRAEARRSANARRQRLLNQRLLLSG